MARRTSSVAGFVVTTLVLLATICDAQLSSKFYDSTCPNALTTIRTVTRSAVSKERRMAASLIRLHFHDCFVQVPTSLHFLCSHQYHALTLSFILDHKSLTGNLFICFAGL